LRATASAEEQITEKVGKGYREVGLPDGCALSYLEVQRGRSPAVYESVRGTSPRYALSPMNIAKLAKIGQDIARLAGDYHGGPKREMLIDPALYAYLRSTGRSVERQFHANLPSARKPPRIDFRVLGPNAVLLEFAVRPPVGGSQLYGSQNRSELYKLCRFDNTQAKLRALLLIDLSPHPLAATSLKPTYDKVNAGPGKFPRSPVKVIYTHADLTYSFKWSPFKYS
jgi:hypothetical protein